MHSDRNTSTPALGRQNHCFVFQEVGCQGFLWQVRNQIYAMQLEHGHKHMMFNNAWPAQP